MANPAHATVSGVMKPIKLERMTSNSKPHYPGYRLEASAPRLKQQFSTRSLSPALFPADDELDYKKLDILAGKSRTGFFVELNTLDNVFEAERIKHSPLPPAKRVLQPR